MSENRQIAKNSIILYVRLVISTIVGLYVSRIVLLELGVDDFGLFAVVGGLISIMNIMNSSMISTSNRYISVELGKKENNNLNKIFNTLFSIHILLAIILIILTELIGVWYVKNYLNIDVEKIPDALFVLHISVLSTAITTAFIPFQGLVNSYEKFNIRVSIEILLSFLQLGFIILLTYYTGNKLKTYAIIVSFIGILTSLLFVIYCRFKYRDVIKWKLNKQKSDYFDISAFFGWNMVYIIGSVGSKQGGTLILNHFFGTAINAAFGIASKVFEYLYAFMINLNQAAGPQIMKNFSGGNQERSVSLVYILSKYSFFLMIIPSVPIMLSIDPILDIWLKTVPVYTRQFVILMIIQGLISCIESGFDSIIDATGKIRKSRIIFSIIVLSTLPVSYLMFKMGYQPYTISIIFISAELLFLFVKIRILSKLTDFKIYDFILKTIFPILLVSLLIIPQILLTSYFGESLIDIILLSLISIIITMLTIYIAGISKKEKLVVNNIIRKIFIHKFTILLL